GDQSDRLLRARVPVGVRGQRERRGLDVLVSAARSGLALRLARRADLLAGRGALAAGRYAGDLAAARATSDVGQPAGGAAVADALRLSAARPDLLPARCDAG